MEKLGVERRVLTAGENKAFLDPFAPLQTGHVEHAQEDARRDPRAVHRCREERARQAPEGVARDLQRAAVVRGQSIELGLSDGFGSVDSVAREVIKAEQIVDYTRKDNIAERFAKRFGAAMADTIAARRLAVACGCVSALGYPPAAGTPSAACRFAARPHAIEPPSWW